MRREAAAERHASPQHLGNPSAFLGFATRKSGCHHPSYSRATQLLMNNAATTHSSSSSLSRSNSPTFASKTTAAFG